MHDPRAALAESVHAPPDARPRGVPADRTLVALAAAKLLLHATAITRYGYFRDELYYLVCARHPAAGYVDQPPLSIALLAAWRWLVGDSLAGMRLVPLLAHMALVALTLQLTRRLGGGVFAQTLAGVGALSSLVYLGGSHHYSMNPLDVVFWALASLALMRALERGRGFDWAIVGAVVGLGLMNKLSMLWCAGGLALGVAASARRRVFATAGPWLAAGIAGALFAPYVLWQIQHGWPTLEFMHNATTRKMAGVTFAGFALGQVLAMNPLLAPVWMSGLVSGFRRAGGGTNGAGESNRGAQARLAGDMGLVLAVQYVAVFALLMVAGKARAEYLTPAYPGLLALGAIAFERGTSASPPGLGEPRRGRTWWRIPVLALPLAGMLALLPFALPVLPSEAFVRYQAALGRSPATEERHRMGVLPQHYADMFGWPELADSVARASASLTADERARAIVVVGNYGEAGALEMFGAGRLPRVACQHNNWYLWGPPAWDRSVAIFVGRDSAEVASECAEVRVAGMAGHPLAMPYERDLPIVIGRGFWPDLAAAWKQGKNFR